MVISLRSLRKAFDVRASTMLLACIPILFLVGLLSNALPRSIGEKPLGVLSALDHAGVPRIIALLGAVLALGFFLASLIKKAPKFQFLIECAIGASLILALMPDYRGQELRGVRLNSNPGRTESAKRDYARAEATEVLRLVITDWMAKDAPNGYRIDPIKGTKVKLERVLIDWRYVPEGFNLEIQNVPIALVEMDTVDLKSGETCIFVSRFEPKSDGSDEVHFRYYQYGIGNPSQITYLAKKEKGKWSVKLSDAFSI
jgi:hypothetical protein